MLGSEHQNQRQRSRSGERGASASASASASTWPSHRPSTASDRASTERVLAIVREYIRQDLPSGFAVPLELCQPERHNDLVFWAIRRLSDCSRENLVSELRSETQQAAKQQEQPAPSKHGTDSKQEGSDTAGHSESDLGEAEQPEPSTDPSPTDSYLADLEQERSQPPSSPPERPPTRTERADADAWSPSEPGPDGVG